jgi:DNA repair photolyase
LNQTLDRIILDSILKNVPIMIKIQEINAKSILNKSKIFDYCVNTYTGCGISCKYCYASLFMPDF